MDRGVKKQIKSAPDWESLYEILGGCNFTELNSREVELIYRKLEEKRGAADLKVAYLSNYTVDLLAPYLGVLSATHGIKLESYIAPYGQYFQELLSPSSGLMEFEPGLIVLDLSISGLSPDINENFLSLDSQTRQAEYERLFATFVQLAELISKNTDAYLLISNLVQPPYPQGGVADLKLHESESEWYLKFNLRLINEFKSDNRVFVVDKNNTLGRAGKHNIVDYKMLYLAKMELNDVGLKAMADEIVRYVIAIKGKTKKNLVLDLDNTLWGGIVGEDGVDGISIGKGYPEGEVFYAFQRYIKNLKQRGVILSIASKNNQEDAEEAFSRKATDMPLQYEDFASRKINWEPKHENIISIAENLNIGIDSFVFLDDNPVERELVRSMLTQVSVPELPTDASAYLDILRRLPYFEKLFLTDEDIVKAQQYAENAQRADIKASSSDMATFLTSLGTKVEISRAQAANIQRIHQLFSKTNQFNVTTKRYSVSEVEDFISDSGYELYTVSVRDNFGDMGMIGVVLIDLDGSLAKVDSFIMSCRAMGRSIETAVMNVIKERFLESGLYKVMEAKYIPTAKNVPVKDFFEKQGFVLRQDLGEKGKQYVLVSSDSKLLECPGIEVNVGEE